MKLYFIFFGRRPFQMKKTNKIHIYLNQCSKLKNSVEWLKRLKSKRQVTLNKQFLVNNV